MKKSCIIVCFLLVANFVALGQTKKNKKTTKNADPPRLEAFMIQTVGLKSFNTSELRNYLGYKNPRIDDYFLFFYVARTINRQLDMDGFRENQGRLERNGTVYPRGYITWKEAKLLWTKYGFLDEYYHVDSVITYGINPKGKAETFTRPLRKGEKMYRVDAHDIPGLSKIPQGVYVLDMGLSSCGNPGMAQIHIGPQDCLELDASWTHAYDSANYHIVCYYSRKQCLTVIDSTRFTCNLRDTTYWTKHRKKWHTYVDTVHIYSCSIGNGSTHRKTFWQSNAGWIIPAGLLAGWVAGEEINDNDWIGCAFAHHSAPTIKDTNSSTTTIDSGTHHNTNGHREANPAPPPPSPTVAQFTGLHNVDLHKYDAANFLHLKKTKVLDMQKTYRRPFPYVGFTLTYRFDSHKLGLLPFVLRR